MKEISNYLKRTQKDYSMSFKLQIAQAIEQGQLKATQAIKKYGIKCRKTAMVTLIGRTNPF